MVNTGLHITELMFDKKMKWNNDGLKKQLALSDIDDSLDFLVNWCNKTRALMTNLHQKPTEKTVSFNKLHLSAAQ